MNHRSRLIRGADSSNAALLALVPAVVSLAMACGEAPADATPDAPDALERPQTLHTEVVQAGDGSFVRRFHGRAAPENVEIIDPSTGTPVMLYDYFPRPNCPFAIDKSKELGAGGYELTIVDRTLAGQKPSAADGLWPLNMVPFGVAMDGAIIDPSGPWYDGGPADPENPFDRACSGWEYDPIFPVVSQLVGVHGDVRGHVQPGPGARRGSAGLFHYHGNPTVMLANLREARPEPERRTPLVVGYSADGFWIIDATIPAEATTGGERLHLFSGYVLRAGERHVVPHTNPQLVPEGTPDGVYVQDFVFDPEQKRALIEAALAGEGEYYDLLADDVEAGRAEWLVLDERNGLTTEDFTVPNAPSRSYVYVLTPDWPEVPRWFAFEPSQSFRNNLIPYASPPGEGPPGRRQLYEACAAELSDVHQWSGHAPY